MIRNMEKVVAGFGGILFGALLLSSCNTLKGTETGVKQTAYGVGQTVEDTAVGAEKDIHAVTTKSTSKHQMMDDANHEPAG